MTRILLLLVAGIGLLLPMRGTAQFDEAGILFGITHYSGDLTERVVEPLEFNRAWGFYLRKKVSNRFGVKFQFMKGTLSGNDANSSVGSGLWKRNLNFHSDIFELGAMAEYSFFKIKKGAYGASPYVFGGLAGLYFTPYTELDGVTYDLNHYHTEGVEYSLYQFVVPFGAGMKLQVNGLGALGMEVGFRKTFTDYLDDVSGTYPTDLIGAADGARSNVRTNLSYRVQEAAPSAPGLPAVGSQRGNPAKKDWYFFMGLTLGINLK